MAKVTTRAPKVSIRAPSRGGVSPLSFSGGCRTFHLGGAMAQNVRVLKWGLPVGVWGR